MHSWACRRALQSNFPYFSSLETGHNSANWFLFALTCPCEWAFLEMSENRCLQSRFRLNTRQWVCRWVKIWDYVWNSARKLTFLRTTMGKFSFMILACLNGNNNLSPFFLKKWTPIHIISHKFKVNLILWLLFKKAFPMTLIVGINH